MLPTEFIDALNAIQTGLGEVPVPVLAVILLGGPTLLWLGFRYFVVQARNEATPTGDALVLFWICERCRSANEVPGTHCYQCGIDQAETRGVLQIVAGDRRIVVDGVPVVRELAPLDRPLVPVGPGHDPFAAVPGARAVTALDEEEWAQEPLFERLADPDEDWSLEPEVEEPPPAPVPVAKPPRRAVVVGAAEPTTRRRKRSSVSQSGPSPKGGTTRAEGSI